LFEINSPRSAERSTTELVDEKNHPEGAFYKLING